MELLFHLVYYHNIWFKVGHTNLRGDCTSSSSLMSRKVNKNWIFTGVQPLQYKVQNVVVSPCPASSLQTNFANVQTVVSCLSALTKFALVWRRLLPSLKVGCSNFWVCCMHFFSLSHLIKVTIYFVIFLLGSRELLSNFVIFLNHFLMKFTNF